MLVWACRPAAGQTSSLPSPDRFDWQAYFWIDARSLTHEEEDEGVDPVRLERARVGVLGEITRRVHWFFSAELTRRTFLRSTYIGVDVSEYLTVRAGHVFPAMSFERSYLPGLEITQTPLTRQLTYGANFGVTAFNRRPFRGGLRYNVSLITGTGSSRWDDNGAKDVVGRLMVAPRALRGVALLVSGATGEQPSGTRTRSGIGVQYDRRSLKFTAEGFQERFENDPDRSGFYLLGVYRIRPEVQGRLFRRAELVARHLVFDDGTMIIREWQMGGNYYLRHNFRFTANIVWPVDDRPCPEKSFITRTQLLF